MNKYLLVTVNRHMEVFKTDSDKRAIRHIEDNYSDNGGKALYRFDGCHLELIKEWS